jgi:deoxycytidylate deaminase
MTRAPVPPQAAIDAAIASSLHSSCGRSRRGVAIFASDLVIATGTNHFPFARKRCDKSDACKATCGKLVVHAEAAALSSAAGRERNAAMLHVKTLSGRLVESGPPSCPQCAVLIAHFGIATMWLYHSTGWTSYSAERFMKAR